jgi:branched-chain amino acid transport system substrate-binding protein
MKKTLLWIVGIVIVIVLIVSLAGKDNKNTGPVKIGFIGALSGDAASFGETDKGATQIAIDEINAKGGVNGRPIEVVYEDGKCNGKDAVSAISKLINIDKVSIVLGGSCSTETLASAPIAEENKVILFSAFSSNPSITTAGDYVFRNSPSDSDVGLLDADTIIKKGYKNIAILSENNDYAQGVRTVMLKRFSTASTTVVYDGVFPGGTTDFRDHVVKIKAKNPDVVYVNPGSSGKTGALFVKQLREAKSKVAIHGNFSLGTPDSLEIGMGYLDGVVISDSVRPTDALLNLEKQYEDRFGKKAANDFFIGASYDRAKIIAQAISSVGTNSDKIKNYLYSMSDYNGIIGNYHFDSNGDVVGGPFFTEFIISGKSKELLK